ncbi:hypothetical protein, partial [Ruminococcus sp.]|uniref:hypothetical protein n=1 Tax=Ruminococcus sp. TaxID=41978 RepID=UPI0025FBD13E
LIFVQKALDNLSFEADSDSFESALETIGRLLGFVSSRPDRETRGEGPDNLWALGNGKYWVIECKNEARTEEISKDYCNQLGGSIRWFQANYPREYNPTPILVHISSTISEKATPVDKMRIINEQSLNRLRDHILRFYTALISLSDWNDEAHIRSLLNKFELNAGSLEKNITVGYR